MIKKRYLYIFDYGVVVFANYTVAEKKEFIAFVKNYASTIVDLDLLEEYRIEIDTNIPKVIIKNDYVSVPYVILLS